MTSNMKKCSVGEIREPVIFVVKFSDVRLDLETRGKNIKERREKPKVFKNALLNRNDFI